jgi:hypothetical protein
MTGDLTSRGMLFDVSVYLPPPPSPPPKKRKKDKSNLFNNKDKKTSNVNKIAQN